MTNQEFFYWLKGYFDLNDAHPIINERELRIIKNHLELVKSIEPHLSEENKALDALLNQLISGKKIKPGENSSFFIQEIQKIYKNTF